MIASNRIIPVKAVLFDLGGVMAEEEFRKGFEAIAAENGLDPIFLYTLAVEVIFESPSGSIDSLGQIVADGKQQTKHMLGHSTLSIEWYITYHNTI